MSSIFQRATVRCPTDTTGIFVPETPARMFQGAAEMSLVMLARLRDITPGQFDSFYVSRGSWAGAPYSGGFRFWFSHTAAILVWQWIDGAQGLQGQNSRVFTANDEGKVHRIVATLDPDGEAWVYVNGIRDEAFTVPVVGYTPATGTLLCSVLGEAAPGGGSYESGVQAWDVMDIALISRGFTKADVSDLDKQIMASSRVPSGYNWNEQYRAERLVGHSLVWDAGGQSAGRGWPAWEGDAPIVGGTLIQPNEWGGF